MDNYDVLQKISTAKEDCMLATIVRVDGSAYRKAGAMMLFTQNGNKVGMLSVGCLEEDLEHRAHTLLKADGEQAEKIVYDMSAEDDLGWGRGVGCNGKVHILLEKLTKCKREHMKKVLHHVNNGVEVMAVRHFSFQPLTVSTVYHTGDGHLFGDTSTNGNDYPYEKNTKKPHHVLKEKKLFKMYGNTYIHQFKPQLRLFIFGAGEDVKPLAKMAAETGFSVYVWDWRPALLTASDFPGIQFVRTNWEEQIHFMEMDAVVIMTHDFQRDKELLHKLLEQPLCYLGILGPRKRTTRLLEGEETPDKVSSPVGLAIGAEGAEEIAISILADLIRVKRGVGQIAGEKNHRNLFSSGQ